MTKEDETLLWIGFGLYLLSKYEFDVVPALERQGANLFEMVHPSQQGHADDLPRPERMTVLPPNVKARLADLETIAKATGFPDPKLAAAIAMAESGGRANEITDTRGKTHKPGTQAERSIGLWQINILAHKGFSEAYLLDPLKNAKAAFQISKRGTDWRPWTVYNSGRYQRYL